jgi:hypothetical protein
VRRVAFVGLGLVAAASAHAQNLVLDVPVRVANVHPSASVGSVTCTAFGHADGLQSDIGFLGTGTKWFALARGGFSGTVAVPVRFEQGKGPARAYRCALYLIFKEGDKTLTGAVNRLADPGAAEFREAFRAAPGAALVHEVKGLL